MEIIKEKFLGIEEEENVTSCGRTLNKFMSTRAVGEYLGLENNRNYKLKNFIGKEFRKLEEKYKNQNVDFCLNEDLKDNVYNYNILETGKVLSAFTL